MAPVTKCLQGWNLSERIPPTKEEMSIVPGVPAVMREETYYYFFVARRNGMPLYRRRTSATSKLASSRKRGSLPCLLSWGYFATSDRTKDAKAKKSLRRTPSGFPKSTHKNLPSGLRTLCISVIASCLISVVR